MSIQSEITRISGAKSDIADAIEEKGVTVPSGSTIDDMAELILQISSGSDVTIIETPDSHGGTVLEITGGIDLSNDTVTASKLVSGYTAHDSSGTAITGTFAGVDVSATTAVAGDVAEGKAFFNANGTLTIGTAEGATEMTVLSYGNSTWKDFLDAYSTNTIVYCRASSNSNPASGSQTRMAFMAYVNNATNPTSVEFQYYRSVNQHSDSQQGDQVYVYKLDKTAGWTVTVRENYTKIVAGTGLGSSYSSGVLTLTNSVTGATASPAMDGTAAVGSSTKYAKEDHVHPTDTSRASAASVEAVTLKIGSITLALADWTGNGPWEQEVTLTGETVTANTMVNLQASPSTIAQLKENDITEIVAENDDGTVTIYCRGQRAPKANITLQYTLVETSNAGNVAILGNPITVGLLDYLDFDYTDGYLVPNATNVGEVSIMNGMVSNGWVLMSFSFLPKVAYSAGTEYEIATLSTALYNKVGRTWREIGIIETNKNVAAIARVDTWSTDDNDAPLKTINFKPSTSYATSAKVKFSIMFPVSYNL